MFSTIFREKMGWRELGTYLTALIWPHCYVSECSACEAGVDACAKRGVAFFTIEAAAVGDIEGEDDSITFL